MRAPRRRRTLMIACAFIVAGVLPLLIAGDDDAPKSKQYALLVGVKNYKKGELKSLKYTENDVNDLADVLKDAGYKRVVVMTQAAAVDDADLTPTGQNIREQLRSLLEDRKAGDTVLVAFSGHGVQFKGQDDHYFCPADARLADRSTLISLSDVYGALKGCKAEMKLLVVDACRSDPQPDDKGPAKVDLESVTRPQAEKPPGGVAALFSCSEGQRSYESDAFKHGVFFHYLIEGMKGEAANKKGEVTLERLASYVKEEVPDRVKEQEGPSGKQLPHLVGDLVGAAPLATTGGGDMTESPYYPMRAGTTWTYTRTTNRYKDGAPVETKTGEVTFKVLKHERFGATTCAQIQEKGDGAAVDPYYVCVKEDGVCCVAFDGMRMRHVRWLFKSPAKAVETWQDSESKWTYMQKDDQEIDVAGKKYKAQVVTCDRPTSSPISKSTATSYFVKGIGEVMEEDRIEVSSGGVTFLTIWTRELEKVELRGK